MFIFSMDLMFKLKALNSVYDILFMFDFNMESGSLRAGNMKSISVGNICLEDFNGVKDLNYGLNYFFYLVIFLVMLECFEYSFKL